MTGKRAYFIVEHEPSLMKMNGNEIFSKHKIPQQLNSGKFMTHDVCKSCISESNYLSKIKRIYKQFFVLSRNHSF